MQHTSVTSNGTSEASGATSVTSWPSTHTENGAPSLSTTGDARLDLFSKVCRDTEVDRLVGLLERSWAVSPLDTLKIVFHLRDCRGGKGERQQFTNAMYWLMDSHRPEFEANFQHIPFYGRWKDLLAFLGTAYEAETIKLYTKQLQEDMALLVLGGGKEKQLTLAAKYAPSEGQSFDTKYQAATKFARSMGMNKRGYRVNVLRPLRSQIDANALLLERHMTDRPSDWESIDFSKVPSIALKKYKRAFERHQKERYAAYLDSVKKGEKKINVLRLMPHEIVGAYIGGGVRVSVEGPDSTVETQWKAFVEQTRAKATFGNAISMVDVSGSMGRRGNLNPKAVSPITVSVAMGILIAELTTGPFRDKVITFAAEPKLISLEGETLYSKTKGLTTGAAENTNIQAAFDLLLNSAKMFKAAPDQMPKTLFIFSDMQFDDIQDLPLGGNYVTAADGSLQWIPVPKPVTNFEALKQKYADAGYQLPRIVFWNLRGDTDDFVVSKDDHGTACISGFSSDLLKLVIDGKDISPLKVMLEAIGDPRYDRIVSPPLAPLPVEPESSVIGSVTVSTVDTSFSMSVSSGEEGVRVNFGSGTKPGVSTSVDADGCIVA